MSKTSIALACALVCVPAVTLAASPSASESESASYELWEARQATKPYRSLARAERDGYVPAGECVSGPTGAMGFHYVQPGLAADAEFDIRRPELLVYERRHGRMHLVAIEYFRADADQRLDTDDDRPSLFGQAFDGPMEGHEPGMPIHYDLHAWVHKRNPDGVFAQYNPRVSC
jgi:hypothetical protein